MSLGLTNGTTNYSMYCATNSNINTAKNYGANYGISASAGGGNIKTLGITTDSTKSGIIVDVARLDGITHLWCLKY